MQILVRLIFEKILDSLYNLSTSLLHVSME